MIEKLREKIGLPVLENEVLALYTTFKIGGPAKYFVTVSAKHELQKALQAAVDFKLRYFLLGGGSNVLISDNGFDGLVIRLTGGEPVIANDVVTAFAGNDWAQLVRSMAKASLTGFEPCGNIPGTVGGAVRGNAGAYGVATGDFIRTVECLVVGPDEVGLKLFTKEDCHFAYRDSVFKQQPELIVAEASWVLSKSTAPVETQMHQIEEEYQSRCAKQPLQYPSAGCAFTNVIYTDELARYKDWEKFGKIPAGKFIDDAGLKGMRIGGAMVAEEHANFIVNVDHATAEQVIQLISLIKMKVRDGYGVQLQEEVQYIGFDV